MGSIDCKTVRQLLVQYADGELDESRRRAFAAHLAQCADCRAEAEELRASLSKFMALAAEAEPVRADEQLIQRILDRRNHVEEKGPVRFRVAFAAAAMLMVLLGAFLLVRLLRSSTTEPNAFPRPPIVEHVPELDKPPVAASESPPELRFHEEHIRKALLDARREAVLLAMAEEESAEADESDPEIHLTVQDAYEQIPAIMLAAADFMHNDIGDERQAVKKYRRIVKLFPASTEARIAQSRLAQLVISNQEG